MAMFWSPLLPIASLTQRSGSELVKAIEDSASRDMTANNAGIFNWSPFSAHKHTDADLSIEAYRRPRLRGIGGLVKGRFCTQ